MTLLSNTVRSCIVFPTVIPGTDEFEVQRELESKTILNNFHRKYGRNCPNFIPSSFKGAIAHAQQEKKLLLVYIHSDPNQNTDKFVEDILCNPDFLSFVSEKFCCWITTCLTFDGYSLSNQTHTVEYPLLLLFSFSSEYNNHGTISATKIGQWEGLCNCNELIFKMNNCYNEYNEIREREEAERITRESERRMKEEMEREYERAMETDRQRILTKQEEDEKRSLENAISMSLEHEREMKLKEWEKKFEHEPSNIEGLCGNFRFSFPNGKKIQRKFLLDENLNTLFDYVEFILDKSNLKLNKFTLDLGYPKTVFRRNENNKSLKEHELIGNVALLVVEDNSD